MNRRVLVFANGVLPDPERVRPLLRPDDVLIAADGGTYHLLALGLRPHVVVGDLDSLPLSLVSALQQEGTVLYRYPSAKDETDLELALHHALTYAPQAIRIVGALGLRLDQTLANVALLAAPWLEGIDVRLDDGLEEVLLVRSEATIEGQPGETVSLLPWGTPVEGITTDGLRWPLREETLYPDRTRGISNELTAPRAHIRIRSGLLIVVHRRNIQRTTRDT
ncbi:MAG: thiamine diphosphokinase [Anaerolineae bacterium]|nr:thiamine diphosphokinase [Anaerolineae bacterium]MCX8068785.1 thiamine diphosphokinase [Anaerolineae bacterium]MDW7990727.1 thiamine diphosphokinase [Anaerolineae bacterium]